MTERLKRRELLRVLWIAVNLSSQGDVNYIAYLGEHPDQALVETEDLHGAHSGGDHWKSYGLILDLIQINKA